MKASKELLKDEKEGDKDKKYLLDFNFILGFHAATLLQGNVFLDY